MTIHSMSADTNMSDRTLLWIIAGNSFYVVLADKLLFRKFEFIHSTSMWLQWLPLATIRQDLQGHIHRKETDNVKLLKQWKNIWVMNQSLLEERTHLIWSWDYSLILLIQESCTNFLPSITLGLRLKVSKWLGQSK